MKRKAIKICLAIVIFTITIFGIYGLTGIKWDETVISNITAVKKDYSVSNPILGTNPNNYTYSLIYYQFTPDDSDFKETHWWIPTYANYQIYCIQPDAHIRNLYDSIQKGDASQNYIAALGEKGKTYTLTNGHVQEKYPIVKRADDEIGNGYLGLSVPMRWLPESKEKILPAAMSYVVSSLPEKKWSQGKQKAIWKLAFNDTETNGIVMKEIETDGRHKKIDDDKETYTIDKEKKVRRFKNL